MTIGATEDDFRRKIQPERTNKVNGKKTLKRQMPVEGEEYVTDKSNF